MADNPDKPDQGGDIDDDDYYQSFLASGILSFGLRGNYTCSKCGEEKAEKKTANEKTVPIPHCCKALVAQVQESAKNHDLDLSPEQMKMHLKQLEGRMDADPKAEQSKTPRGPYKCGRCGFTKKGHCKCKTKRTS